MQHHKLNHPAKQTVASIGEAMLELTHASAWNLALSVAGDTLNTAVYLSRLLEPESFSIYYATALGVDPYSDSMIIAWQQERLHTDLVIRLKDRLPGLYLVRTNSQGERSFYYYRTHSAARELFKASQKNTLLTRLVSMDYLYLSAITLAILDQDSREYLWHILAEAKRRGAQLIFDTNYRVALWHSASLARICVERTLALSDIVLPTFSDDQQLFGDLDPQASAKRLIDCGASEIVIKCGSKPCLVANANEQAWVNACQVSHVVDTTAAGDAFNAGYLAARFQGLAPLTAATYGHHLAAVVISHPGAIIPSNLMPKLF